MSANPNVRKVIASYLAEAKMMQLATSSKDQPWVCNVWFGVDDALGLYWISTAERRHSQELAANPKVAASVILPHVPGGDARALQVQGTAQRLVDATEIEAAIELYVDRIFPREQLTTFMQPGEHQHYFYRLQPTEIVLFDNVNFPDQSRQVLTLG